ncbi:MAG: mobile mystery protein B [Candidatus Kapaibacterium sp.]
MGLTYHIPEGQTPLGEEEKEGILNLSIERREELDGAEQINIEKSLKWIRRISPKINEILSEEFIKTVHKNMFDDVWSWAGSYRTTNKNLGSDKFEIGIELRKTFDDCKFWIGNKTFIHDEIAVRLKHRIVVVHPFANGNGRHSRLMGDILINKYFKLPVFSWGGKDRSGSGEVRKKYLEALRKADNGKYEDLITFARS